MSWLIGKELIWTAELCASYWLGCSCFRAERVISGLGLLQLLVVLEIVLGSLVNFHPYSRPLCLATQVSIIEDSACRVRIILTCLLNTVYPTTIPIHHLGWSLSVYMDTKVIWDSWIYYGTWCLGVQGGCRWVNFGFGTLRRRHELCPLCLANR